MYESFYGLSEKPFSLRPDPSFLFSSPRHSMAYSMLEYAVSSETGFTVITGDVGAGKTTLIRHLLNNLPHATTVGMVNNTHEEQKHLLEWVMLSFGEPYEHTSPVALFDAFQQFLIREYGAGRRCLLIIDEAQNLTPRGLEALRLLSNINADEHQLLQMILTGQPELKAMLSQPELRQFAQRIGVHFHLPALPEEQVDAYISHRIKVAGRDERLFTRDATTLIARYCEGVPRSINIICDTALVYGYASETALIDVQQVAEVFKDRESFGVLGQATVGTGATVSAGSLGKKIGDLF
jgi:type II secretory pathway predicted ATPase ExeA